MRRAKFAAIVVSMGLALLVAVPAGASPKSTGAGATPERTSYYERGEWETSGVAGVYASGIYTWSDGTCYIYGDIKDTKADGHAAGVQIVRTGANLGDPGTYFRQYNYKGNGHWQHFEMTISFGAESEVEIREFISEQGTILDRGGWEHLCGGLTSPN